MNAIRQTQALNKRELENAVSTEASWHADYRDTAYIYIGGLPFDLSEGDIITIFSQYGEPVHVNLVRDKDTGKSKGFAFLKYEDQRSTDLAVDNLGGATIMGRMVRVDHTRYKRRDDEEVEDNVKLADEKNGEGRGGAGRASDDEDTRRPMIKEEIELAELMRDHDEEDPMKAYLIEEKKEEMQRALAKLEKHSHRHRSSDEKSHRHRHRRRSKESSRSRERKHRHRDADGPEESRRSHRDKYRVRSRSLDKHNRGSRRSRSRERKHHTDRDDRR